ncbi:unnamed protein product [Urochloa decumbens]|uniref:Uncharacterized protein n=1 Tax=Urochloa decumbens TaxID=240449 RepID=A0ABC9EI11_9POAL
MEIVNYSPLLLRPTAWERRLQPLRARRWQRRCCLLQPACTLRRRKAELEKRIREQLRGAGKNLLPPPSPYDTAWVAMVPAEGGSAPWAPAPRFPQYLEWIMQNQHDDGSWGIGHLHLPRLGKDAVSSTLACILALRTWDLGDEHIRKGLRFIRENSSFITNDKCDTPVGFNIIFPAMIRLGNELGLESQLKQCVADDIFRLREMELQSWTPGRKAYLAYVAEGLGDMQDWDEVLPYQIKNGSLFNSPSATSALAIYSRNSDALKYLDLLGSKFHSSVPVAYPMPMFSQLCMVDIVERMGISCHFSCEISSILDSAYRSWMQNKELITDTETCAIAFRLLRIHGYDISSDAFFDFAEESEFKDSVQGHLNDTKTLLELYKASQIRILEDEWTLENIGSWSGKLLQRQVSKSRVLRSVMPQEVECALRFPFYASTVEPLDHRRSIEHFNIISIWMQKSAYLACPASEDILALATEKFCSSQYLYQQKLQCIERWVKEAGLDRLEFARALPLSVFVFMASNVFTPESHSASIAWIQNCILQTIIDDFFDGGGSTEELRNLVALIEGWDTHASIGFCSDDVEILFLAVYKTNNQIGARAANVQKRRVIDHIAEVWVSVVRAFMVEAEWTRKSHVPTMEEYMPVAEVSTALGPAVTTSLYLVGPELSEEMIRGSEYNNLLRQMYTCIRFMNDLHTNEKESSQGCINSVLLGAMSLASIEAAKREIQGLLTESQRELLRLVLIEGGVVPRSCRDIFWNTYKIGHRFYLQGDGCSMPQELVTAVNAVVHEPLQRMTAS